MNKDKKEADEMLQLVGRLTSNWAVLDLNFDSSICALADLDQEYGKCILAQFNSHPPKIKAVIALAKMRGAKQESLKALRSFEGRVRTASDKRNRIIHDAWLVKGGKIIGKVVTQPDGATFGGNKSELENALNDVLKLISEFAKIRIGVLNETGAMHKAQRGKPPANSPG